MSADETYSRAQSAKETHCDHCETSAGEWHGVIAGAAVPSKTRAAGENAHLENNQGSIVSADRQPSP